MVAGSATIMTCCSGQRHRKPAELKDFRHVATRYDKLARNCVATLALAASVIWWLN
jgi:transposase